MKLSAFRKNRWIEGNRKEFGEDYDRLLFVTESQAAVAQQERSELLYTLRDRTVFCCKNTKLDGRNLSRGCEICTQGNWSCLFINGRCNCRCFYCPTQQEDTGVPTTNSVSFPKVADYVDYIQKLGFKGVSLSGGEPLLTLESTLKFLHAVKHEFGDTVYTWLYTNGTLATRETLLKLKAAGLKEIRFDIGATGMNLEAAKRAVDILDTVTVEIPSLPDQFEIMKEKIEEMEAVGVCHLNLHQLRLTHHNLPRLLEHPYTFLHGERVTVLESELAALRLIHWAYEEGKQLPINYCSFVYKNRFQRAAARRKSASFVCKPYEEITENGYIRSLELNGEPDLLSRQVEALQLNGADESLWTLNSQKDRLRVASRLWPQMDFANFSLFVSYAEAKILPAVTYRNAFVEMPLNKNRSLYVEKAIVSEKIELDREMADHLQKWASGSSPLELDGLTQPTWERIYSFEVIEKDLGEYF